MKISATYTLFVLLTLSGAFVTVEAQESRSKDALMAKDFTAFSWEMSIPTDNKFLSENSFSGWRLEYRRMLSKNLSIGIAASWNAFDETFPTKSITPPTGLRQ